MSLEFDSDFDGYLDVIGHGVSCTYTPAGGSPVTIKVILDQEYYEIPGDTVSFNGSQPIVQGKAKDLSNGAFGDQLAFAAITDLSGNTIKNAATYKIVSLQPDNTGMVAVVLEEQ